MIVDVTLLGRARYKIRKAMSERYAMTLIIIRIVFIYRIFISVYKFLSLNASSNIIATLK